MTLQDERGHAYAEDLARRLLVDWRVRCAVSRAAWQLTSGQAAAELSRAVVATLQEGVPGPELGRAVRSWGSRVASPAEARGALQCLGEAVTALVAVEFGDFRPRGLDPTLEQLAAESMVPAGRRTAPAQLDPLTRCPDRAALASDLAVTVPGAWAAGEDLTLAVLALDDGRQSTFGRRSQSQSRAPVDDGQLLRLLATVRHVFGRSAGVYRVGEGALGVLAARTGAVTTGELILRATCLIGPPFAWGTADLHSVGEQAVSSPDVLLMLAEADLVLRRRDYATATATLARRRQFAAVGSIAAAMLLVAGAGVAIVRSPGSAPAARSAAPAHHSSAPAPLSPPTTVPAPAPTVLAPPPAGSSSTLTGGGGSGPVGAPTDNAVLTSFQAPVAPSPPPSTPPTTVPAPAPPQHGHGASGGASPAAVAHGHSAGAGQGGPPGHAKG